MVGNNLSAAIITVLGPSPIFSTCGRNTASLQRCPFEVSLSHRMTQRSLKPRAVDMDIHILVRPGLLQR